MNDEIISHEENKKGKFSKRTKIIAAIAGILLLCCCGLFALGAYVSSTPEGQATATARASEREATRVEQTEIARIEATEAAKPTSTPLPSSTPTATTPPTITPSPTNTPLPTSTLEPSEALRVSLNDVLGDSNREGAERVAVEVVDNIVFVIFAVQDNFSADWIRSGMANDTLEILSVIHDSGILYEAVSIQGTFPLRDAYGNVEESPVLGATYNRETIERINFSGSVLIFDIADEPVFIHQAMLDD